MALGRKIFLPVALLLAVALSTVALVATVQAGSAPAGGVSCSADGNSSGFIERIEVIAVIRAYLDGAPCLEQPEPTDWAWSVSGSGTSTYTVLSRSQSGKSPWWLNLECVGDEPSLFFGQVWAPVYSAEPSGELDVVVVIDGDARLRQMARYNPAHGSFSDYLRFVSSSGLIKILFEVDTVSLELPGGETADFRVQGLDQRVSGVSEVCG